MFTNPSRVVRIPLVVAILLALSLQVLPWQAMPQLANAEEAVVGELPASVTKPASGTKAMPGNEDASGSKGDGTAPQILKLAAGKLTLPVPGEWKQVKPRSRIIKHEFSLPVGEGDETPGRMTIMAASGGVEANIERWVGQFRSADGKPLPEEAQKVEKKKIGDQPVYVVDLAGTFQDSMRGPFGPKVDRPDYRMLAAIIPLKQGGTWFIKSYGPVATMKDAEKPFHQMIAGVKHSP